MAHVGLGTAIGMAGSVIKGVGGYSSGKYNRDVANTGAIESERAGEADVQRMREQARQQIGQQVAGQFSNGMQGGTGSATDYLLDSQVNAAADAMNIRRQAAMTARGQRVQGDLAYAAGKNALSSGLLSAAQAAAQSSQDWARSNAGQSGGGKAPPPKGGK